jgi:hypothetical protein
VGRIVPLPPFPLPIPEGRMVPLLILIPPFPPVGRLELDEPFPDPFPLIASPGGKGRGDFDDL